LTKKKIFVVEIFLKHFLVFY